MDQAQRSIQAIRSPSGLEAASDLLATLLLLSRPPNMNTAVTPARQSRYAPAENPFETPEDQAAGYWTYPAGQPQSPARGTAHGASTIRTVDKALPTSPEGYRDTRDVRGAYASGGAGGEPGFAPGPASPVDEVARDERMGVVDKSRPRFAKGTSAP